MPKITEQQSERRRQEILTAAVRCFARAGVRKTTMRDIFKESGLSAGAVYNYFPAKSGIVEAIVSADAARGEGLARTAEENGSAAASFEALLAAFLGDLEVAARDGRARLGIVLAAEAATDPELLARLRRGREQVRAVVRAAVDRRCPGAPDRRREALTSLLFFAYQGMNTAAGLDESLDKAGLQALLGDLAAIVAAAPPPRGEGRS